MVFYSLFPLPFFSLLLVVQSANTGRPSIGFCNEFLLGSKYAVLILTANYSTSRKAYLFIASE